MSKNEFRLDMGASWLNLLSTVAGRFRDQQSDAIATPVQLGRFLDAVGLAPRRRPDADDLAAAHALREGLYEIARARVAATAVPRGAVRVVNAALAFDSPPALSVASTGLSATRPADTRAALARIARQALDQVAGADLVRLRACGDADTCASIFIDESGRRRYCNDALCGTRIRVQAHRARARAAKDPKVDRVAPVGAEVLRRPNRAERG